jgi:hypothetical protein
MNTLEARSRAQDLLGPDGTAHMVKYTNAAGHYAFEYRVGLQRRGVFIDRFRGTSYDACFDQARRKHERRPLQRANRMIKHDPRGYKNMTEKRKLLESLIAERDRPAFRRHDLARAS